MKYVVLNSDNSVAYTFPQSENDSLMYSSEFLNSCILVENLEDVPSGYICNRNTKTFIAPPPIEPVIPEIVNPQIDPVTQTQLALAELAETESAHDLENKLALAELAEMIGGTTNG